MHDTNDRLNPVCWRPAPAQPLLATLRDWLARHWRRKASASVRAPHDELVELDAHTLVDIGAPEALIDRAMARRELQRQEREGLRLGVASGAWQHW